MNRQERQVLHGLYFHRQLVGERIPYNATEIAWLAQTRIPKTKEWVTGNGPQSVPNQVEDYLLASGSASAAAKRQLYYLRDKGYIDVEYNSGMFRVAVTAAGGDLARQLDSRLGRCNYWYNQHKDGLIGILITIIVSVITAGLTALLVSSNF